MQQEFTELIRSWQGGDIEARDALMEIAYARVRQIAARSIRHNAQATISPTELAHEALLRLLGADAGWEDRRHFFHVVAAATRQILVDRARRRTAERRGGGIRLLPLDEATGVPADTADEELLRVNAALERMEQEHGRPARIVELSYFGGFPREQIAAALELSVATVDRDLRFARAWLRLELAG